MHEKKPSIEWIPGREQQADVLTKALGMLAHNKAGRQIPGYPK
jgi:hypothetical protein